MSRDPWRYACPECGSVSVRYRKTAEKRYLCWECHARFDKPFDKKLGRQELPEYIRRRRQ
jgi:predicted SprT family Zn-dependent metalloprotease